MFGKISKFFIDCKNELKKVAWPSKQELVGSVVVVIVSLMLFSIIVLVMDVILDSTIGRAI